MIKIYLNNSLCACYLSTLLIFWFLKLFFVLIEYSNVVCCALPSNNFDVRISSGRRELHDGVGVVECDVSGFLK